VHRRLLGHRLTNVAGSSDYFVGGAVTYSYDAKEWVLNVRHETLYDYGAVSEQTALEMARGARRLFHTDVALSVTVSPGRRRHAGKPVGLTYIALSARDREECDALCGIATATGTRVFGRCRVGNAGGVFA